MLLKREVSSMEFRRQGSINMGKIEYQFFFSTEKGTFLCPSFVHGRFAFFRRRRSLSRSQKRANLRSSENSVMIPLTTPSLTIK